MFVWIVKNYLYVNLMNKINGTDRYSGNKVYREMLQMFLYYPTFIYDC